MRMSVLLPDDMARQVEERARRRLVSKADIVREALLRVLGDDRYPGDVRGDSEETPAG